MERMKIDERSDSWQVEQRKERQLDPFFFHVALLVCPLSVGIARERAGMCVCVYVRACVYGLC